MYVRLQAAKAIWLFTFESAQHSLIQRSVYLSAQINIVIVIIINAVPTVAVVAFHSVAY